MWMSLQKIELISGKSCFLIFWVPFFSRPKAVTDLKKACIRAGAIESITYPYKSALSEANGKANRMGSTKWTYYKERSFTSIYFILLIFTV